MSRSPLALRSAQKHLSDFKEESDALIAEHNQAMNCRDCEDYLRMAIDVYQWLMRADTVIRRAVYRGLQEYDPRLDEMITESLRDWVDRCGFAEKWADEQATQGFQVDNLEEFKKCHRAAVAMLTPDAEFFASEALVNLRDEALDEHSQGRTGEYRAI